MVASGVKIPKAVANAANFLAGTIGSAAEQKFARGRVSAGRSILGGLANMAGNSKYGTGKLDNWKDAAVRGVKAGGLYAGLGYLADVVDPAPRLDAAGAAGLMAGMAGSLLVRNPGRCGSPSPFQTMLGYGMAKGYRYGVSQTGFGNRKKPSFTGFLCEGLRGAVTGGVSSVAFYGLNKGIVKLWDGFRTSMGGYNFGKYQKASLWERLIKRKASVNELHANPWDDFSNPKIGPSESAVSKYIMEINQTGKLNSPIEVQKLTKGGYEIVNGHHRWLAAIKTGLEKVSIRIKNYSN